MFVLDASAMLAVLNREPGAEVVLANMQDAEASIVNIGEVLSKTADYGIDPDRTIALIRGFEIMVREFSVTHALAVARMRPLTRHLGLSFGDRACLVQAQFSGVPILTSDQRMAEADVGIDIRLIR